MLPHQDRVVTEHSDLADKTEKLGRFIGGELFNSLAQEEQVRLEKQYKYMRLYLEVLHERIAAF
jgi:hypothetical protein